MGIIADRLLLAAQEINDQDLKLKRIEYNLGLGKSHMALFSHGSQLGETFEEYESLAHEEGQTRMVTRIIMDIIMPVAQFGTPVGFKSFMEEISSLGKEATS